MKRGRVWDVRFHYWWSVQISTKSTIAAVSAWKQSPGALSSFSARVKQHESCTHPLRATTQMLKVICQPSFFRFIPRWEVEFAEWWFKMSGFRVDGGQRARWDALWEKRAASGRPTILWAGAIVKPQSWGEAETEHSRTVTSFYFFDLFAVLFIDLVFPLRVQTLHRADATTLKLVVIRKCRDDHRKLKHKVCTEWRQTQREENLPSEWLWRL